MNAAAENPLEGVLLKYGGNAKDREMEMISEYLEWLRRKSRTEQTIDGRAELLYRLDRDLKYGVGTVSAEDLSVWLYRDEWSQNTRATYWRGIKSFYTWAADPKDPWLDANPTIDMPAVSSAKPIPRAATDEQVKRVMTEAVEPYLTWSKLAAYQGLRCIEISRLDREHVTEQQLFVVRGKGNRPRVHDTHPVVWATVKGLPGGAIARNSSGERETAHGISYRSKQYFTRSLKLNLSLHRLRHWLGTTVQKRYRDIRVTQAMLGHVNLASTQVYTDATDEQQRDARSTLPVFGE